MAATHQPQQSAEAMLQHMQIQHWWSHLHTLQCNASTLHGILRAPHGDGKEAILLATPVSGVYASILGMSPDLCAATNALQQPCRGSTKFATCMFSKGGPLTSLLHCRKPGRRFYSNPSGRGCTAVFATCTLAGQRHCLGHTWCIMWRFASDKGEKCCSRSQSLQAPNPYASSLVRAWTCMHVFQTQQPWQQRVDHRQKLQFTEQLCSSVWPCAQQLSRLVHSKGTDANTPSYVVVHNVIRALLFWMRFYNLAGMARCLPWSSKPFWAVRAAPTGIDIADEQ